ncbi:uncharacterized protein LOC119599561 [Lucilia sericata]|uniref:uncharacterized protein LOC119599561 n=1 Tax=Lucilia sericata TaxID=13632 RepID=UPI0018A86D8D|nr:uncharacterized protein LOC119599561 [Lucilia sericata]
MSQEFKLFLSLSVLIIGFILTSADTKIFLPVENSYRSETITLDNEQHLLVKGSFEENFDIPMDTKNKLFLTVFYVADKDGYKAKYVLMKNEYPKHAVVLSPSTLKSTAADTKVLRKFSVSLRYTLRDETISLNDDGNLVVEGGIVQKFSIPNDDKHVQKLDIVFVADKNGYRPIVILVKEKFDDTHRLAVSTLKSTAETSKMKIWQFLAVILVLVLSYTQGEIKILSKINIFDLDSQRQETIYLKNENTPEEELIIEGTHVQKIYAKDNTDFVYRIETIYVADKDGYRVKYKLIREPTMQILLGLSPSTLKSTAG